MRTAAIRQKLHQFIETVGEKRIKAMYALFEDEIAQEEWEYTDEFKKELEKRYAHYINGGKMVSAADANKQIKELLKTKKKK